MEEVLLCWWHLFRVPHLLHGRLTLVSVCHVQNVVGYALFCSFSLASCEVSPETVTDLGQPGLGQWHRKVDGRIVWVTGLINLKTCRCRGGETGIENG